MIRVESKEKGDLALAKVISKLYESNIKVALPISEHLPFDLIAIDNNCNLYKISVKYRKIDKHGSIEIPLRQISCNSKGYKIKKADLSEINIFCVYCPDINQVLFVKSQEVKESNVKNLFIIRVSEPIIHKNLKTIRNYKNYLNPLSVFDLHIVSSNDTL